jgi:hypothetical protein
MLQAYQGNVNTLARVLDLFDILLVVPLFADQDSLDVVRLTRNIRIPARAEAIVSVTLPFNSNYIGTSAITEPWARVIKQIDEA